jgi:hypothetical protein
MRTTALGRFELTLLPNLPNQMARFLLCQFPPAIFAGKH